MDAVPTPPDSTKNSLRYRLITRTRERWPQLADLTIRHRGQFAYIDGNLPMAPHCPCSGCVTAARPTAGASRSTSPAATATKTPSCPADTPSAPPKKPSTAPAASTSTTPPPGPNPRRTNGRLTTHPPTARAVGTPDRATLSWPNRSISSVSAAQDKLCPPAVFGDRVYTSIGVGSCVIPYLHRHRHRRRRVARGPTPARDAQGA